jgi:hypothetical protein
MFIEQLSGAREHNVEVLTVQEGVFVYMYTAFHLAIANLP